MAKIEFVCASAHEGEDVNRDGPAITLNEKLWAYCSRGGLTGHAWQRIPPTTMDELAIAGQRPTTLAI